MKKLNLSKSKIIIVVVLVIAIVIAVVFGLTQNKSSYASKISDGSQTFISDKKVSVTKQEFYEYLLDNYGASQILDEVLNTIADKEITDQKEIDKLLQERIKTYAQYSDGSIEEYAKSLGYSSAKEYEDTSLLPQVKQELLRKKYINENFDSLMSEFQVCSMKKIVVSKESSALSIIKKSTSEEEFDKQMKTYDDKGEDLGIITKNTTLDDNLLDKLGDLSKINKDGVYKDAIKLSDDSYAVVFMYNTDHNKNKDEYQETLASDGDVQTKVESYYLKKYEFTVNEKKLKDAIKEISSDYID